jgi:hypothetical protein
MLPSRLLTARLVKPAAPRSSTRGGNDPACVRTGGHHAVAMIGHVPAVAPECFRALDDALDARGALLAAWTAGDRAAPPVVAQTGSDDEALTLPVDEWTATDREALAKRLAVGNDQALTATRPASPPENLTQVSILYRPSGPSRDRSGQRGTGGCPYRTRTAPPSSPISTFAGYVSHV